jgi:hypothetical protein
MSIIFSNSRSRIFALLFYRLFVLFFGTILLSFTVLIGSVANPENSRIMIIAISLLLLLLYTGEWFAYFRYILNYYLINKGSRIIVDTKVNTVERINGSNSEVQNIEKVILCRHVNSQSPFSNPKNKIDKIENLISEGLGRWRFKNLWYLEIITDNSKYHVTPIMTKLKDLPFRDLNIAYIKTPLIKRDR